MTAAVPSTKAPAIQEWRPHRGPQERFLANPADEVLYGGAAGGGKSDALLVCPLRWVHLPQFHGMLLRREATQLWGSLWPRAQDLYRPLAARWRGKDATWHFPSGARIEFGSAKEEQEIRKYQGRSLQYIGWDEGTHFTWFQYQYMFSRLRCAWDPSFRPRMRIGTNPGGVGHEWVLARWAPWLYPPPGAPGHDPAAYAGPWAKPGEILWFLRDDHGEEQIVAPGTPFALTRTAFPARVRDNPCYAGGAYERNLNALQLLDRAQLRDGDWMARPAPGKFFKRAWLADRFIEATVRATAETDLQGTRLVIERDPGQAGTAQAFAYARALDGFDVHAVAPVIDKIGRCKPVSAQAEAGNVLILRGAWNEAFLREAEAFPEGWKDQIDGLSGGYNQARMFGNVLTVTRGSREITAGKTGGF